jgi:hypothetical protein
VWSDGGRSVQNNAARWWSRELNSQLDFDAVYGVDFETETRPRDNRHFALQRKSVKIEWL